MATIRMEESDLKDEKFAPNSTSSSPEMLANLEKNPSNLEELPVAGSKIKREWKREPCMYI